MRRWVSTIRNVDATTIAAAISASPANAPTPTSTAVTDWDACCSSIRRWSVAVRTAPGEWRAVPMRSVSSAAGTPAPRTSTWSRPRPPASPATASGVPSATFTPSSGTSATPVTVTGCVTPSAPVIVSVDPGTMPVRAAVAVPTTTSADPDAGRPCRSGRVNRLSGPVIGSESISQLVVAPAPATGRLVDQWPTAPDTPGTAATAATRSRRSPGTVAIGSGRTTAAAAAGVTWVRLAT